MSENKSKIGISVKSFISSIAVIFALMVVTYVLTFFVPAGSFDSNGIYSAAEGNLPFYKFLLSPVLVLGAEGSGTLIAVIVFILVIGGIFNCLDECSFMRYLLDWLTHRFSKVKYSFMALLMLFFMLMGAFIGSFEEVVPMVPIVTALAVALGWDIITGLAMSILAVGCGFASGVCNPFTVGIAQRIASVPMFSGVLYRLVAFVFIYALLLLFTRHHAKKTDRNVSSAIVSAFASDRNLNRALRSFCIIFGFGIILVLCSCFLTFLQDYTLIIVALTFLVAGIVSSLTAGMSFSSFAASFGKGCKNILPSVLMILMASSIKFIMTESRIQDTLLFHAINVADTLPKFSVILFMYLIVLIMNFFIASGSAKAMMIIPLLLPIANHVGISANLCIMAFAFGDGFSNIFYPTNPALLISLGVADISYAKWVKWSWKFQLANLALTSGLLVAGFFLGY